MSSRSRLEQNGLDLPTVGEAYQNAPCEEPSGPAWEAAKALAVATLNPNDSFLPGVSADRVTRIGEPRSNR